MTTESEKTASASRNSTGDLKQRRKLIKPSEIILILVFVAVVVALVLTLINRLSLRNDVANAQEVSTKVIADIAKRDGAAIRSLGTTKFQETYTASQLSQGFRNVEVATYKTPTLDTTYVINSASGRTVFFVYKYSALKVPFYVRVTIVRQSGHWRLTAIDGNVDESQLLYG